MTSRNRYTHRPQKEYISQREVVVRSIIAGILISLFSFFVQAEELSPIALAEKESLEISLFLMVLAGVSALVFLRNSLRS